MTKEEKAIKIKAALIAIISDSELYAGGMGALDEAPDIDQHHPGQYADPEIPFTPEMQKQIDDYFLSLPIKE